MSDSNRSDQTVSTATPMTRAASADTPAARRHWASRLLFAAMLVFVLFMALHPAPPQAFQTHLDKANHSLAFFGLMVTGCFAFAHERAQRRLVVALVLLAVGALIEVVQLYVPGRSAEWLDLAADAAGIALGWVVIALLRRLQRGVGEVGEVRR